MAMLLEGTKSTKFVGFWGKLEWNEICGSLSDDISGLTSCLIQILFISLTKAVSELYFSSANLQKNMLFILGQNLVEGWWTAAQCFKFDFPTGWWCVRHGSLEGQDSGNAGNWVILVCLYKRKKQERTERLPKWRTRRKEYPWEQQCGPEQPPDFTASTWH